MPFNTHDAANELKPTPHDDILIFITTHIMLRHATLRRNSSRVLAPKSTSCLRRIWNCKVGSLAHVLRLHHGACGVSGERYLVKAVHVQHDEGFDGLDLHLLERVLRICGSVEDVAKGTLSARAAAASRDVTAS